MAAPQDFRPHQDPERFDWIKDEFAKIRAEMLENRRGAAVRGALHFDQAEHHEGNIHPDTTSNFRDTISFVIPAGYRNGLIQGTTNAVVTNNSGAAVTWYFPGVELNGMGAVQQFTPYTQFELVAAQVRGTAAIPFSFEVSVDAWQDHTAQISIDVYSPQNTVAVTLELRTVGIAIFQQ